MRADQRPSPATGDRAIVLELALPHARARCATLAVAVPPRAAITLDSDILDSVRRAHHAGSRKRVAVPHAGRPQPGPAARLLRSGDRAPGAVSVDEMKTNFLANVSHELRTPLTSIRSFAELLLAYEDDPAVQKEFLRIISTESERLTRLVNDVLDISRIEAGHMDWKMDSIDMAELVTDLGRTFCAAGPPRPAGIRRSTSTPPCGCGVRRPRPTPSGHRQPAEQRHEVHPRLAARSSSRGERVGS